MEDKSKSLIKNAIINLDVAKDYPMEDWEKKVIDSVSQQLNQLLK